MKTTFNLSQYFPVLTISLILIAASIEGNAQNRQTEKKDKESKRTEYRSSNRNDRRLAEYSRKGNNEGSYEANGYKNEKNNKIYQPKYTRKTYRIHPNHFNHPKYGKVYQRFEHNPVVFKHDRGNYYYYGDHFYTYRRGVGYCLAETPRNMYFEYLPSDCSRVYLNGQVLFRNGDLFFRLSPRGYTIVPSPFEVRFSSRF